MSINNLDATDEASYSENVDTILEKIGSGKDTNTVRDINTALGTRLKRGSFDKKLCTVRTI